MVENDNPCPFCGGTAFTWGIARGHGSGLDFVPGETFFERLKNLESQDVKARRCDGCGNLQLFVPQ